MNIAPNFVSDDTVGNNPPVKSVRYAFKDFSGISVNDAFSLAAQGLPAVSSFKIEQHKKNLEEFVLTLSARDFTSSFGISFSSKAILPGEIENKNPNRQFGRMLFANRALLGLALDMQKVEIYASLMMGGFIWAKAGVCLMPTHADALSERLTERAKLLKHVLDKGSYDHLLSLCLLGNADSLRKIALLSQRINDPEVLCTDRDWKHAYSYETYKKFGYLDKGMSVGMFILFDMNYAAFIDLQNQTQMQIMEDYCKVPVRALAGAFTQSQPHAARSLSPVSRRMHQPQ